MNERLAANGNVAVAPDDPVVFGGDLTISSSAGDLLDWLDRLNGEVVFVVGDHDGTVFEGRDGVSFHREYRCEHAGVPFLVVHDPEDAPTGFPGGCSTATTTTTGPNGTRS
jgi:calcineurin-like phosphoesterase family protein